MHVPRLHTARPLLALAALIVAFAFGPSGPASAAAAPIQLGAYVPNGPEDGNALDAYAAMVGQKPDIVMKYSNPTDPLLTPAEISNLESRGETPMVTWQLYKSGWSGPTIPLSSIAAGNYDTYLRRAADLAKGLPFDVMIRFGHEMNGNWYGWSGQPAAYVAAWRHVVSVFRGEGADNVKWVWSPNVDNGDYPFTRYFPATRGSTTWPSTATTGDLRGRREPVAEPLAGVLLLLQDAHPAQQQAGDLRRDLLERDRRGQGGVDQAGLPEDDPAAVPPRPGGALVQSGHGAGLARQLFLVRAAGISRRGVELPVRWPGSGTQQP